MESQPAGKTLVRRLPRAVLVGLAVALVGGGAIGFAAAADGEATTFSVPEPMGGDEAVYAIEPLDGDWARQAHIQVRPPGPFMLADGRSVSAYQLRAGSDTALVSDGFTDYVAVGWETAFVDAATGDVVAHARAVGSGAGGTSGGPAFGLLGGESSSYASARSVREYDSTDVPCATRSGLQGRSVAIGDRVGVEGCGAEVGFQVEGIESLQGVDSLVVASPEMRLWYQPGIPYPVLFEFNLGSPDPHRWRMTGFARGQEPLVPGPVPPPVRLPSVELAPADRFGPSLGAFDHPFPLQDAVAYARDHSAPVADFVAGHADWFVRSAAYEQEDRDGQLSGIWSFTLRGDREQMRVLVPQPEAGQPQVPGAVDRALGTVPLEYGPDSSVHAGDVEADEPAWPAACRPAALPALDGMAARWAAMERRAAADANAYGFSLDCFSQDELSPTAQVLVGDDRLVYPPSSGPVAGPGEDRSQTVMQNLTMLRASGDGQRLDVESSEVVISRDQWGALGSPDEESEGAVGIQGSSTGAWAMPSQPVAASITIVSVLAAILYWLWPALKAGPLALFTRLETPQLLEHPMRKELMQRIEAHPGVHYQDLVRAMGKGKGTIEHHLRKLQAGGLVKSVPAGGYTCFFPAAYDRRLTAAAPALKSEGARKVLAAIRANPGASAMQVGAATGLSPAAINHHLQRLGAAGLVDVLRNGRSLSIQPTALASQVPMGEPAAA